MLEREYDPRLEAASYQLFKVKGFKFQIQGLGRRIVHQSNGLSRTFLKRRTACWDRVSKARFQKIV